MLIVCEYIILIVWEYIILIVCMCIKIICMLITSVLLHSLSAQLHTDVCNHYYNIISIIIEFPVLDTDQTAKAADQGARGAKASLKYKEGGLRPLKLTDCISIIYSYYN